MTKRESILASLTGSAIGDAVGLPYENLSSRRAAKLLGPPDRFRMCFGRGMVSDDAEHACMTAAALANCGGDPDRFARDLARRLRWWLLTVPAGIGLATLKSILKLWVGVSPRHSGVWSAGNGPAMRAAVIGRAVERERLVDLVRASTSITHRDEKAFVGALAVALAACEWSATPSHGLDDLLVRYQAIVPPSPATEEMIVLIRRVEESVRRGESTTAFANGFCRKPGFVSGYILETVPIALHSVYANAGWRDAIEAAIQCGGDTDSVASIAGGIRGVEDLHLIDQLLEWPCDRKWLVDLADAAATAQTPPTFPFVVRLPRNVLMVAAILVHVLRRALPPY